MEKSKKIEISDAKKKNNNKKPALNNMQEQTIGKRCQNTENNKASHWSL